jgi:glycosyltransferase involved in cell wall biosynthesis
MIGHCGKAQFWRWNFATRTVDVFYMLAIEVRYPGMISVCICTYNRSKSLQRTLESFASQLNADSDQVELLIIDNNCTDDTCEIVETFRKSLPVRRVTERQQGLGHARNRAVTEAQGDVLLFTDDDVRVGAGWLAAYQEAISSFPGAGYFGGRILPDWGSKKPRWVRDEPLPLIDGLLVWFDHGTETRPFEPTEPPPFGASFAIRRQLFDKIGVFRIDLGTGGMALGRGEETEFLMRARNAGVQGIYVGEALCFHAYDPSRLTSAALYRYGIACGRSHNAITSHSHHGGYRAAASFVIRGMVQILRGRGDRFRQCIINAGIEMGARSLSVRHAKGSSEFRQNR